MVSTTKQSVAIDATHQRSKDLRSYIANMLCAASPASQQIDQVTLFCSDDDATQWPEQPWLNVVKENASAALSEFLQSNPQTLLVSLNSVTNNHPNSSLLLSDTSASVFDDSISGGGLLGKLRTKMSAQANERSLGAAANILCTSHYGDTCVTQLAKAKNQMVYVVPDGVDPDFFRPMYFHRMVDKLTFDHPFVWLTNITHQSTSEVIQAIEAVDALHKLGAFVELKLLLNDDGVSQELDKDDLKRIGKAIRNRNFVEVVKVRDTSEMPPLYHAADGFIWGQATDRDGQYLFYAMASGLPIVAASTDLNKRHLGQRIRFFRPMDDNDLADTLERSMADIHFRIIGSARNHKRSLKYTWEKTAAIFFATIQNNYEMSTTAEAIA